MRRIARREPNVRFSSARAAAGGLVLLIALSGCAGFGGSQRAGSPAESGLYDGEPTTVYATEFPIESADDARLRGAEALSKGDMDRALYFYVEAAKLEPSDSQSLYTIGAIHERRGNQSLAAQAFSRAVQIDPEHARALQGLGLVQFEAHETELAKATLERAIAAEPSLWRAHNVLGVMADTNGDYEAAAEHYSAALEARPGAVSILNNRGYSKYMSGDLEAAKQDFLAVLEVAPEHERAWQNLGLVYAREHDYNMALRALSRVMERHVAANDVGYIAMLDGDYESAEYLFAEAIRLSPRYYKTAIDNAAELRRRRGADSVLAIER